MDLSQLVKTLPPPITNKVTQGRRKLVLIVLSAFLILFSILFLIFLRTILGSPTIYRGVRIQGTDVGGFTKGELLSYLEVNNASLLSHMALKINGPQFEWNTAVSDLGIKIDFGAMAEKAYALGRTGNIFDRFAKILKLYNNPVSVGLMVDYETEGFNSFLDKVCQAVYREVIPSNLVITEDSVILCTGISGQEADRELLRTYIIDAVQSLKNAEIIVPVKETLPPPIDVETALQVLNKDPVNAEFVKTSRTTYEIKPHQAGRRIERDKLMETLSYVENRQSNEYEEIPLPVETIAPSITEENLRAQLFRDTLSTYTTHFNTNNENNYNRSINIGLAAESIDGTLLLPGEEFSFNKIVGPRTSQKGYKTAHIFVDGQIQDGTGGGVCQVSTTLYNAVLNANLEVTERHNHMFTVGYVPLGQDAAVSYGYADLVFKNTAAHPLRIIAEVSPDNNLTFKIQSTNDYPGLKVKLANKTIATTPLTIQYVDDSSLPQGTEVIAENGQDGYVVDTYIKILNGDVLIKEEKLHRSIYQMLPRKILRGTAPVFEMVE